MDGTYGRRIGARLLCLVAGLAVARSALAEQQEPLYHVWNPGTLAVVRSGTAPPERSVAVKPILLTAPRNGYASGQVVVAAPQPLGAFCVKATIAAPLATGGTPPSLEVETFYPRRSDDAAGAYDNLWPTPDPQATLQPVWVRVRVPGDVPPGKYSGVLRVTGLPHDSSLPIELTVADWTLPPPREWACWTTFFESPESVAAHYRVPLWSEAHFKKLEKSLELLGQLGQRMVTVPVLANSILGREPLLVFRREGGKLVPDFRYVEPYLRLYAKCCGKPELLCLQVWDAGGLDGTPLVELQGEQRVNVPVPVFGAEGTEELWKAVLDGTRKLIRDLGWKENCLALGLDQDLHPGKQTVDFFRRLAPEIGWVKYSHFLETTLPTAYAIYVDEQGEHFPVPGWTRPFPAKYPVGFSARGLVEGSTPAAYRVLPISTLLDGRNALAAWGLDSWMLVDDQGRRSRRLYDNAQLRHWMRLVRNTVHQLTFPGPEGALPTVRYEMLREGLQEAEALAFCGRHKDDPALDAALKARLAALCKDLAAWKVQAGSVPVPPGGRDWPAMRDEIYLCAAEVRKQLPRSIQ